MRKFVSSPQVYTGRPGAGRLDLLYTFPHTLGVEPHIVRIEMRCLVADKGYPAGAVVPVNPHSADQLTTAAWGFFTFSSATGYSIKKTATDVILSIDTNNGMSFHQFGTKKNARPNNGAWEIVVKAYAP